MQLSLFGETETDDISIKQASIIANVSIATIRNWIKLGYLKQTNKGFITWESLNKFMIEIAGKEKLNSRANKLLKDSHNQDEILHTIHTLLKSKDKLNGKDIGFEYEKMLSESYRNKEGIYYTPLWIINDMFKNIEFKSHFTFLDPCCGSGNFLIEAIKHGIPPENVYGFDTDENAVLIAKKRIKDEFGYETNNIKVCDFLEIAHQLKNKFDLIFTNPPWGKKIGKSLKEKYSALYGCGSSYDTTSLFLGASLYVLKDNGFLGFLVQEAFFNVSTFEDIRKRILAKKIIRLVDYAKPFKGLITKAQAIILENSNYTPQQRIECNINQENHQRTQNSFFDTPKHIFNFWANENDMSIIKHLYSYPHITLKNRAKWALGIVTGNNKKFCSNVPKDNYIPVYRGTDITKSGIKNPSLFILNDFSTFQQVAPLEMYQAKEKIIYKFISPRLCFFYDNQQRFILNSANLFIPYDMPISMEQLCQLLNSEIINWLFKKLFMTHKILRSDIELLPIHYEFFSYYQKFNEKAYMEYLQIHETKNGYSIIKK